LAINIDPSPFGAIEAIYNHPETLLDQDPELWATWWLIKNLSPEHVFSIRELERLSGWEYDVFATASGTRARLLKWEMEQRRGPT